MPLHRLRPGLSRALSVSPASSLSCPARTSRRPTSRRPVSGPSRRPVSGPSRRPVSGQRLPAFLVGTPAPAPGSVLALAAQSPSESSAAVGLRPGSAYGAGPLTRRSEVSDARPFLEPLGTGLSGSSTGCIRWPLARGAASRLRQPAAHKFQSRWLATHWPSVGPSRANRQFPALAHWPLVVPAVSTPCWPTGSSR